MSHSKKVDVDSGTIKQEETHIHHHIDKHCHLHCFQYCLAQCIFHMVHITSSAHFPPPADTRLIGSFMCTIGAFRIAHHSLVFGECICKSNSRSMLLSCSFRNSLWSFRAIDTNERAAPSIHEHPPASPLQTLKNLHSCHCTSSSSNFQSLFHRKIFGKFLCDSKGLHGTWVMRL